MNSLNTIISNEAARINSILVEQIKDEIAAIDNGTHETTGVAGCDWYREQYVEALELSDAQRIESITGTLRDFPDFDPLSFTGWAFKFVRDHEEPIAA